MRLSNYTPSLFEMGCPQANIQIVATQHDLLLDLQSKAYDTFGRETAGHATARLPLDTAIGLRDLLERAIDTAEGLEPRQTALWSNSAFTVPTKTKMCRRDHTRRCLFGRATCRTGCVRNPEVLA